MSLQKEIQSIFKSSLSYEEKGKKLAKLVTKQELDALLSKPKEVVALKEPLKPKTKGMKTLHLSIHKVYFDAIITGAKPIEFRDWKNEYYQRKCSYDRQRIHGFHLCTGRNGTPTTPGKEDRETSEYLILHYPASCSEDYYCCRCANTYHAVFHCHAYRSCYGG